MLLASHRAHWLTMSAPLVSRRCTFYRAFLEDQPQAPPPRIFAAMQHHVGQQRPSIIVFAISRFPAPCRRLNRASRGPPAGVGGGPTAAHDTTPFLPQHRPPSVSWRIRWMKIKVTRLFTMRSDEFDTPSSPSAADIDTGLRAGSESSVAAGPRPAHRNKSGPAPSPWKTHEA